MEILDVIATAGGRPVRHECSPIVRCRTSKYRAIFVAHLVRFDTCTETMDFSKLPPLVAFDDILRTTSRLPFTTTETALLLETLKRGTRKGRDYHLGTSMVPFSSAEIQELLNNGIVLITSPIQLQTQFLFVKCDGGRSLFGRQKAVYQRYVGDDPNNLMVGTTFTNWALAVTSIGNVYRGNGYS